MSLSVVAHIGNSVAEGWGRQQIPEVGSGGTSGGPGRIIDGPISSQCMCHPHPQGIL